MTELYAGIATIIAGIITAIVHIIITIQARKSAQKIAEDNINQQKSHFEKTKKIDYLRSKKEFLESKIDSIYNLQDTINFEKDKDELVNSASYDVLRFRGVLKLIAKSNHYLKPDSIKKISEFEAGFNYFFKERAELIRKGIADDESNNQNIENQKKFVEYLNKIDEMTTISIDILTTELNTTIEKIEQIINAT